VAWRFNHPASAPTGDGFHVDFENRRYTATYGSAPRVEAPVEGLQIHDDFVGLAYTADVILQDASGTRTVTTGDTVEYSTTPLPGKTIEKKTSRYLVFQAQAGDAAAFGDWTFDVQSLAGALQGGLAINGVSDLHGSPTLPVDKASLVQLDGDLYLQGAYPGGGNNDDVRSTWTLQGQATMLGIDAHALDLASFNPGLAVAGGAGLLVLLGLLFKSQLAALLAGYTKAEPLGNDARRQMLALIQARPGITIPELGAQLGVQRATVRFHAQVLVRAKLVQQHGRPFHYSPVDADAQASAALSQDVRRRIHAILLGNHAPLARSRIQDLLAAEGKPVSKVLLNWHLRALLDARIVIRQGVNRASTYLLAPIQRAAPSVQAPSPLSVP
jgi:predicted transcriptional regulator